MRLVSIKPEGADTKAEQTYAAVTISSDGFVRVFDLFSLPAHLKKSNGKEAAVPELASIASYDSRGSRLTCLSVVAVMEPAGKGAAAAVEAGQGDEDSEAGDEDEEAEEDDEEMEAAAGDDFQDEDVDTDAEEEELQKLEEQIEEAKAAGLLESEDDDEEDDSGDDDDDALEGSEEENEEDESKAELA